LIVKRSDDLDYVCVCACGMDVMCVLDDCYVKSVYSIIAKLQVAGRWLSIIIIIHRPLP
jgi:hypothetical protein